MNNPLLPTPDVTELRLPLAMTCTSNEYDEDTLVNNVVLTGPAYEGQALEYHSNAVMLPVPQDMAEVFVVGQEYQVEVKVTISDRGFTPFKAL